MTLSEFERQIKQKLLEEAAGPYGFRCQFRGVLYADKSGLCAIRTTIIGAGPNKQRARQDFVEKIRGKWARVFDGLGAYQEFGVPRSLAP